MPFWVKLVFAFIVFTGIYAAVEHWPDGGKRQDDRIEIQIRIE